MDELWEVRWNMWEIWIWLILRRWDIWNICAIYGTIIDYGSKKRLWVYIWRRNFIAIQTFSFILPHNIIC